MTAEVPVLRAERLCKTYRTRRVGARKASVIDAVDGVSLDLIRGRIAAVVGESGSGKSTTARMLLGIERPSSGRVMLGGRDVRGHITPDFVQMIFQDPFASLNPLHTVAHHVHRALALHRRDLSRDQRAAAAEDLLERVQLTPVAEIAGRRPHQLSGGQRQRVSIARALAVRPKVLLADEPVSMLDVSMRLGILNLLRDLARDEHLAMLYITHDIATARYFADTILVMYRGRLVEGGPAEAVTQHSAHPYTRLLLDSAPDPDRLTARPTGPPSAGGPAARRLGGLQQEAVITECSCPPGCANAELQRRAEDIPQLVTDRPVDETIHWAACSCSLQPIKAEALEAPNHHRRRPDAEEH